MIDFSMIRVCFDLFRGYDLPSSVRVDCSSVIVIVIVIFHVARRQKKKDTKVQSLI